jgi:tetrahydromethanopterin S-methyltransferase subunit B
MMDTYVQTHENARKGYIRSALVGALYGFLMGTTFVLVAALIDTWLYPELPVGVDWDQELVRFLLIGGGITLIGALTNFFPETFQGLIAGTIAAGLLALIVALFLSPVSTGLKLMVLLFTLVPIAIMCLPLVLLLRYLTSWHARALQTNRSMLSISALILVAVALGAVGGYFLKMPPRALMSMQMVHENIQATPENQDEQISKTPGLKEHAGMSYDLFQMLSTTSTEAFDVRAVYEDGYAFQCVVVSYPGQPPYIRSCEQTD